MIKQVTGAFFLGTLVQSEQKFVKKILLNAKANGYTRFIEPCSGAFALAHLAVQSGFKQEDIETSDVTLFSSLYGYGITKKPLDELQITATGFTAEELQDHATAMYALMYLKTSAMSGSDYIYALLRDMQERREFHIQTINDQLERARTLLQGMNYRPLDMYDHLKECLDDEKAIVVINPPTYKAGFEKWYDTKGHVTWKEPEYGIFDPVTGLTELMLETCANSKALVICYEENSVGATAGYPVFARYGVRKGINVYLTTNNPELCVRLSEGKHIDRGNETELKPMKCSILPSTHVVNEKSKFEFMEIEAKHAQYYRSIWTHNFVGSRGQFNIGIFIDGFIAGVFGFNLTMAATLLDNALIMYGVTPKHETLRLNRLLTMLAVNMETLGSVVKDYNLKHVKGVQTTQMTKYPESKEMRGLMKLVAKDKGKLGYKLTYFSEIKVRTKQQTLIEFLKREATWLKERSKEKSLNG